jgi:hypothetical protein
MDSLALRPTQLSNIPRNMNAMTVSKNYGNLSTQDAAKLFNQYAKQQEQDKILGLMKALSSMNIGSDGGGLVQFKNYGFNPNQYQQFQSQVLTNPQYKWNR